MKTDKIQQCINAYTDLRQAKSVWQEAWKWEVLKNFQDNWDLDAPDFAAMYDRSLHSLMSRRFWSDTGYEPKQWMLNFIAMQPDWTKHLFRDLFDENKSLEGRISRFLFGCDELMTEYREQHPLNRETSHCHEDYRMISLYLALRYPTQYAPYSLQAFTGILKLLESKEVPLTHDFPRYIKVTRILSTFLSKHEPLLKTHQSAIRGEAFYQGETLMMAHDLCESCTNPAYKTYFQSLNKS